MKAKCKNCKFWVEWKKVNNAHKGRCHRLPAPGAAHQMPSVEANNWCGEFKERRKK